MLMHILAIGESALQSKLSRFCSHKARSRVDNNRLDDLVTEADVASMSSNKKNLIRKILWWGRLSFH